jgi:predicted nucleic acid-binding protein
MHILVDTNIVLDALANRQPFDVPAKELLVKIEAGMVQGSLAATTLTTIFYLMRKQEGTAKAKHLITDLLGTFQVGSVDGMVLQKALTKPMSDFEDAVLDSVAESNGIPIIITRNSKNFVGSSRRILDADEFLRELGNQPPKQE